MKLLKNTKNNSVKKQDSKLRAYELPEIVVIGDAPDAPWWNDCMAWWSDFGAPLVGTDVGSGVTAFMGAELATAYAATAAPIPLAIFTGGSALAGSAGYCAYRIFNP